MRLLIPTIGDELELVQDWTFTLYREYRQTKFIENLKLGEADPLVPSVSLAPPPDQPYYKAYPNFKVTLPAGTVLSVARIYIRGSFRSFDSVTFIVKSCPVKKVKGRFWVKLRDANSMEFTYDRTVAKKLKKEIMGDG